MGRSAEWKHQLKLDGRARPERVAILHLAAFDWNCPQHIPQRWTIDELKQAPLFERIKSLEAEVKRLRAQLEESTASSRPANSPPSSG